MAVVYFELIEKQMDKHNHSASDFPCSDLLLDFCDRKMWYININYRYHVTGYITVAKVYSCSFFQMSSTSTVVCGTYVVHLIGSTRFACLRI